jgi:hypothetical protein
MCDGTGWVDGLPWWLLLTLRRQSPARPHLPPEEFTFYGRLPDPVQVFRGCDRSGVRGVSWTMRLPTAEFFAVTRRGAPFPDPVIASATIPKAGIFWATHDRSEWEIVLDPDYLQELEVYPAVA